MLECKNLSAFYLSGKEEKTVLKDLSIQLNKNEFVCLAGPNGSGKTTLLKLACGLEGTKRSPLKISGNSTFQIDGSKVCDLKEKERARRIAYLQQSETSAWDTKVLQMILTGRFAWSGTNYTKDDIRIAREAAELLEISNLLDRNIYSLSGGEFQKVRIARAVCQQTDYILLDEPCAALDISYEPKLLEILKNLSQEQNKGILISIHDLNLACRFADRIILLPPAKPAICGTVHEIITEENLEKTYGVPLKIESGTMITFCTKGAL